MKRFIAIITVIVMVWCGGAVADETSKASDSIMKALKELKLLYEILPDSFDSIYLMQAYMLYESYGSLSGYEAARAAETLKAGGGEKLLYATKMLLKGSVDLMNGPTEIFQKWLNGEVSEDECKEQVMTFVDAIISSHDKVKEGK